MHGWAQIVVCVALCAGCPGRGPAVAPAAEPSVDLSRVELARLEGKRLDGVAELLRRVDTGSPAHRALAARALGRIGGPEAIDGIVRLIETTSRDVWIEAVRALAIAGAMDRAAVVADALSRASRPQEIAVALFSLGRLGTDRDIDAITDQLGHDAAAVREAAGIALGMYGRRKLGLSSRARRALTARTADLNRDTRYAAAYALAREHEPPADDRVAEALSKLASDEDDEIRAVALYGLARRKVQDSIAQLGHLDDPDWRVSVQAVRGVASAWTPPRDREQLAVWLSRSWLAMNKTDREGPRIHAVVEALTLLRSFATEPAVAAAARAIYDAGGDVEVRCRAAAILATHAPFAGFAGCARDQPGPWPEHEVLRLQLEVAGGRGDKAGAERVTALLGHRDPRVRAAAVTAAATRPGPRDAELLIESLGDPDAPVAGAAIEVIAARVAASTPLAKELVAAVLERARTETDPELRLSLLGAVGAAKIAGGEAVCRAAMTDSNRTIRQAGRDCVTAMTGADAGSAAPSTTQEPPPVDPASVLDHKIIWTVKTTRGTIRIELLGQVAPWHVAVLVSLSNKKFYDGLMWHRVVPDFVIQGGDPAGSGWGGPGFVVPAEPSVVPYRRGAVGIADAGLDTGGSQWFVMHSRAPHLDARYTVVGNVVDGQDVVDSIRVGDQILSATATLSPISAQ